MNSDSVKVWDGEGNLKFDIQQNVDRNWPRSHCRFICICSALIQINLVMFKSDCDSKNVVYMANKNNMQNLKCVNH